MAQLIPKSPAGRVLYPVGRLSSSPYPLAAATKARLARHSPHLETRTSAKVTSRLTANTPSAG
jgi:hypothetical protein